MITTVIAAMFVIAIACSAKDASPPNKGFFNDATASFLAVTVSHGTEALIIEGDGGRSYSEAGPLGIGGGSMAHEGIGYQHQYH